MITETDLDTKARALFEAVPTTGWIKRVHTWESLPEQARQNWRNRVLASESIEAPGPATCAGVSS